ncbi:hypothetical protein HaLaN_21553 [Haematococcus lacustris]|uniref:Uncharacterized protein n=1 Tax=Haematococcus lacustris TaxID=44745 RepID=A0A699ZMG6_HAELA|nr:hypothetical protein HaLaN_21553 [Haematococcus lacustris]
MWSSGSRLSTRLTCVDVTGLELSLPVLGPAPSEPAKDVKAACPPQAWPKAVAAVQRLSPFLHPKQARGWTVAPKLGAMRC